MWHALGVVERRDVVTEPTYGTPSEPDPPADSPTEPYAPPESSTPGEPEIAPNEGSAPTPTPPSGWVQPPPGGGRSRGCCLLIAIAAGLFAVIPIVAIVALIFLGSQVSTILSTVGTQALAGTVEFEAGTQTGCFVEQPARTFPSSTSIHYAAHFEREVTVGETISFVVTYPNGTSESSETTLEESFACVSETIQPGLDPGTWRLEFRSGGDVLATGTFEVTE
jgi:hypothetical protein